MTTSVAPARVFGSGIRRREDPRLLTGTARYTADFAFPGMVFAAHEILRANPNPSADEIRHGLEGNMCRCTGYQNIVRAVQAAAADPRIAGLGGGG